MNTVEDLKLTVGTSEGEIEHVYGYSVLNDGGQGIFFWDSSSTEVDNGGTIINPTNNSGDGRWKRLFEDEVNVNWFGAKGDGVTDDSDAIKNAYLAGSTLFIPEGQYLMQKPYIELRSNTKIYGRGTIIVENIIQNSVVSFTRGGVPDMNPIFGFNENNDPDNILKNVVIEGLNFKILKDGFCAIVIADVNSRNIVIKDCNFNGLGNDDTNQALRGVFIEQGVKPTISNCKFEYFRLEAIGLPIVKEALVENNTLSYIGVDKSYKAIDPTTAIEGQHFYNTWGIAAPASQNSTYRQNSIDFTGGAGIGLRGGGNDCANNIIEYNKLTNIGKGGIGIGINTGGTGDSYGNKIRYNSILGFSQRFTDSGININNRGSGGIYDIEISHNILDFYGGSSLKYPAQDSGGQISIAIYADNSDELLEGIHIGHNTVLYSKSSAIFIHHCSNGSIAFNRILNGTYTIDDVSDIHTIAKETISVRDCHNFTINNNTLKNTNDKNLAEAKYAIHATGHELYVKNNFINNFDADFKADYNIRLGQTTNLRDNLNTSIPAGGAVVVADNNTGLGGVLNAGGLYYYPINSISSIIPINAYFKAVTERRRPIRLKNTNGSAVAVTGRYDRNTWLNFVKPYSSITISSGGFFIASDELHGTVISDVVITGVDITFINTSPIEVKAGESFFIKFLTDATAVVHILETTNDAP